METNHLYVVQGIFGLHEEHRYLLLIRAPSFEAAAETAMKRQKPDFKVVSTRLLDDDGTEQILYREYMGKQ